MYKNLGIREYPSVMNSLITKNLGLVQVSGGFKTIMFLNPLFDSELTGASRKKWIEKVTNLRKVGFNT